MKAQDGFHDQEANEGEASDEHSDLGLPSLPAANPILPRSYIDVSKPKVLFKQIKIFKQPTELFANCLQSPPPQFSHLSKGPFGSLKFEKPYPLPSILQEFVMSQDYLCLYHKFNRTGQKINQKELRLLFGSKELCCSHFLSLEFLRHQGQAVLRNIEDRKHSPLDEPSDQAIQFDSRFESANLYAVFRGKGSSEYTYDLLLQNDVNTQGYNQWFYFSIRNREPCQVRLSIRNMAKDHHLSQQGQRPVIFSMRERHKGWRFGGTHIEFQPSRLLRSSEEGGEYFALKFSLDLANRDDVTFVAATVPYSYSRLLHDLDNLQKTAKQFPRLSFRRQKLTTSISGNECPLLAIAAKKTKGSRKKRIIAIVARQHPSETVASHVALGLLTQLLSGSRLSKQLLQRFSFRIIPMLNPDGVIYGNSRCDISGADINRQWTTPNRDLYPTVLAAKEYFQKLSDLGFQLHCFLDLHGHSKKTGCFIYGNDLPQRETECRLFSLLMSKVNSHFSFQECQFGVGYCKRNTARANMSHLLQEASRSLTVQTSLFGYRTSPQDSSAEEKGGKRKLSKHYLTNDLLEIGVSLLKTILIEETRVVAGGQFLFDLRAFQQEIHRDSARRKVERLKQAALKLDSFQDSDSGSESEPSIDQLNIEEKQKLFLPKQIAQQVKEAQFMQKRQQELRQKMHLLIKSEPRDALLPRNQSQVKSTRFLPAVKFEPRVPRRASLQRLRITNIIPFALSGPKIKESKRALPIQEIQSRCVQVAGLKQQPIHSIVNSSQGRSQSLDIRNILNREVLQREFGGNRRAFWNSFKSQLRSVIQQKRRAEQQKPSVFAGARNLKDRQQRQSAERTKSRSGLGSDLKQPRLRLRGISLEGKK